MRSTWIPGTCAAVLSVFLSCGAIGASNEPVDKLLMDFSRASSADKWLSVNDTVMGGVSTGVFRITADAILEFAGKLSLENHGGFASIRMKSEDLSLEGCDAVIVRLKGDGRTYYFDLRTTSMFPAASYRAPVMTVKDAWREVRLPLTDFEYAAFGKPIPWVGPLSPSKVQSVGFTLVDKQAGPFRLEVAWIKASRGAVAAKGASTDPPPEGVDDAKEDLTRGPLSERPASAQSASAVIELAIERGVPLFNDAHPSACAAVYEVVVFRISAAA